MNLRVKLLIVFFIFFISFCLGTVHTCIAFGVDWHGPLGGVCLVVSIFCFAGLIIGARLLKDEDEEED